jgi:hypothetical protein
MGIIEIFLIILVIAAIFGRGRLALGALFDLLIAILVIGLIIRLIYAVF